MNLASLTHDLAFMTPEVVIAIGAMLLVLIGAFVSKSAYRAITYLSVVVLLLAGFLGVQYAPDNAQILFNGSYVVDSFGGFAKLIIALTAACAILLSADYLAERNLEKPEYPVLALLAVLGMYVMVSAHDLLAVYMGVELQSLALYVLAAYARDDRKSSEAGLKYFVLGALSSGILLYGVSLIYGFTGTINFGKLLTIAKDSSNVGLIFGMVFVLSGIAFKMSVAPFHMWTPDVYEGAPTPSTAFFATAPKMAAAILLGRFLFEAFGEVVAQWRDVVSIMAVLSMFVGAIFALQQTNMKRLLAYSSILNMGYAMVAIAAGPVYGPSALLLFTAIYAITSVGMFGVLLSMRDAKGKEITNISGYSGLSKQRPLLSLALTIMFFSITGIPPLLGFFGKFQIFIAAVDGGVMPLALILVIASVISAFYYLRVLKVVWFDEPSVEIVGGLATTKVTVTGVTLMIALLTPFIGLIYTASMTAGHLFK